MKRKILILRVGAYKHELMLSNELKMLAKSYDIIFATDLDDALDKIARAKLIENKPIQGLVFQRNTLVTHEGVCNLVKKLAEKYSDSYLVSINMIRNDQDSEAMDFAVSATFCKQDDWDYVQAILDNHFKK
jgi:hypothetical protein